MVDQLEVEVVVLCDTEVVLDEAADGRQGSEVFEVVNATGLE